MDSMYAGLERDENKEEVAARSSLFVNGGSSVANHERIAGHPTAYQSSKLYEEEDEEDCYGFGSYKDMFAPKGGAFQHQETPRLDRAVFIKWRMMEKDVRRILSQRETLKPEQMMFHHVSLRCNGMPYPGGMGQVFVEPCKIMWIQQSFSDTYRGTEIRSLFKDVTNTPASNTSRPEPSALEWMKASIKSIRCSRFQEKQVSIQFSPAEKMFFEFVFMPGPYFMPKSDELFMKCFDAIKYEPAAEEFQSPHSVDKKDLLDLKKTTQASLTSTSKACDEDNDSNEGVISRSELSSDNYDPDPSFSSESSLIGFEIGGDISQVAEAAISKFASIFEPETPQEVESHVEMRVDTLPLKYDNPANEDLIRRYLTMLPQSMEAHALAQKILDVYGYPIGPISFETPSFNELEHRSLVVATLTQLVRDMAENRNGEVDKREEALGIRSEADDEGNMVYLDIRSGKQVPAEFYQEMYFRYIQVCHDDCIKHCVEPSSGFESSYEQFSELMDMDIPVLPIMNKVFSKQKDNTEMSHDIFQVPKHLVPLQKKAADEIFCDYQNRQLIAEQTLHEAWEKAHAQYMEDIRNLKRLFLKDMEMICVNESEAKDRFTEEERNVSSLEEERKEAFEASDPMADTMPSPVISCDKSRRKKSSRRRSLIIPAEGLMEEKDETEVMRSPSSEPDAEQNNSTRQDATNVKRKSRRQSIVNLEGRVPEFDFVDTSPAQEIDESNIEDSAFPPSSLTTCELCCDGRNTIEFASCDHAVCLNCWHRLSRDIVEQTTEVLCPWDRIPIQLSSDTMAI